MPTLGERFRAAREARGLTLSDVAEQIRIRSVYLGAIEEENWGLIGAPVYTRGFLRTYARYLGLDPEEVVAEFNGASAREAATTIATSLGGPAADYSFAESQRRSRLLSPMIWVASLVAVLLIAFVFYNEFAAHPRQPVASLPSSTPVVASSAPTSPAASAEAIGSPATSASPDGSASSEPSPSPCPSGTPCSSPTALVTPGPDTMEVRLSAASWIRVVVDGNASMEGTFPAGTSRVFRGKRAVVRIGNAGGVAILIGGKDVGKLGATGDVVERSFDL